MLFKIYVLRLPKQAFNVNFFFLLVSLPASAYWLVAIQLPILITTHTIIIWTSSATSSFFIIFFIFLLAGDVLLHGKVIDTNLDIALIFLILNTLQKLMVKTILSLPLKVPETTAFHDLFLIHSNEVDAILLQLQSVMRVGDKQKWQRSLGINELLEVARANVN